MTVGLDVLLFAVGWAHVLLAPYTKVEESFNLHATHDVLTYGVGSDTLHNFDHFTFPGAVPRTFVGSVLLAWLSAPVIQLANWLGLVSQKSDLQAIVRLVLATLNTACLCIIRRAVSRRFGRTTSLFFTLLTCSQFHIPFWIGRTLPNMFALIPVNIAAFLLIDRAPNVGRPPKRNVRAAITLLTFTAVVFRAEVLLLLAPLTLQAVALRYITLLDTVKVGLVAGLASIALTMAVDSYFWNQPLLWPELAGIYFNVYQGKSSEWGTSPSHAYFTTHLPKLLLSAFPLSLVGFTQDSRIRTLLFPPVVFIALISMLGHKEWRFIVYTVPLFNVAAARGARWMVSLRKSTLPGRLVFFAVPGLLTSNLLITVLLSTASIANYPGGHALALFHKQYSLNKTHATSPPHIHLSNLALQTGASLFLHLNALPYPLPVLLALPPLLTHSTQWTYNKTEAPPTLDPNFLPATEPITHTISEMPLKGEAEKWDVVARVEGFVRWEVDWDLLMMFVGGGGRRSKDGGVSLGRVLRMVREEKLWILERKDS